MPNAQTRDLRLLHPAIAVAGRALFALIFFLSGITHFTSLSSISD